MKQRRLLSVLFLLSLFVPVTNRAGNEQDDLEEEMYFCGFENSSMEVIVQEAIDLMSYTVNRMVALEFKISEMEERITKLENSLLPRKKIRVK